MTTVLTDRLSFDITVFSLSTGEPVKNLSREQDDLPLNGTLRDGQHLLIGLKDPDRPGLSPHYTHLASHRVRIDPYDFHKGISHPALSLSSVVLDLHATGATLEVGTGLQSRNRPQWNPWVIQWSGKTVADAEELKGSEEHLIEVFYQINQHATAKLALQVSVTVQAWQGHTTTSYSPTLPAPEHFDPSPILAGLFFPKKPSRRTDLPTWWLRVLVATQIAHTARRKLQLRQAARNLPAFFPQTFADDVCDILKEVFGPETKVSTQTVNDRWVYIVNILGKALNGEVEEDLDDYAFGPRHGAAVPAPSGDDVHRALSSANSAFYEFLVSEEGQAKGAKQLLVTSLCDVLTNCNAVPGGTWPTVEQIRTSDDYLAWRAAR